MHFILNVHNGLSLEECIRRIEDSNIDIKPLSHYRFKQTDEKPHFVLGFGGINIEDAKTHINSLIECLTK